MVKHLSTTMALQRRAYPVTQHLIEKYYEYVLGLGSKNGSTHYHHNNSNLNSILRRRGPDVQDPDSDKKESTTEDPDSKDNEDDAVNCEAQEEVGSCLTRLKNYFYGIFIGDYEKDLLIEKLKVQKQHAMSYEEWSTTGLRLDELTNTNKWKQKNDSTLYDYKLIEEVTRKLRKARLDQDYSQLLYLIRTNWVRNLGNIGNVNLYRHSHVGTKTLIDQYMKESKKSLEALVHSDLDENYLIGILQQTRRNIGRTALVLSGGGTFGLFHIGVLVTLFELDLLPRVISGSSAGAIVASILTVHYKDEIPNLLEHVLDTDFNIFKDDKKKSESENFLIKISRFFKNGTWFDNKHLMSTMIEFLGDLTFREAYNRTGKILNITVSPASLFEQPRLLNNLTAPNVLIWSAVCASCSLPGIFPSTPLYEKDLKTGETREWSGSSSVKFVDGSVDNDLPISRLSEMFNIDHIIACQVNIHVYPFLKLSLSCVGGEIEDEFSARLRQNLTKVYNFMANEVIHALEIGSELGIAKNTLTKLRSVLSQQYSGDVTILPEMKTLLRVNELLTNPTKEFLLREITNGARATWPKVSIIQNHCGQEFALDKAISYLKGKMIVSSSIKNPLQFSDTSVGLIKSPSINGNGHSRSALIPIAGKKRHKSALNDANVLDDDNILDSDATSSLSLLRENARIYRRSTSGRLNFAPNSMATKPHRRKSDTGTRVKHHIHHYNNGHGKQMSFSVSSPGSRISRQTSRHNEFSVSSHKRASSGHIYPPFEARSLTLPDARKLSRTIEPPNTVIYNDAASFVSRPTSGRLEFRLSPEDEWRLKDTKKTKKRTPITDDHNIFATESDNEDMPVVRSIIQSRESALKSKMETDTGEGEEEEEQLTDTERNSAETSYEQDFPYPFQEDYQQRPLSETSSSSKKSKKFTRFELLEDNSGEISPKTKAQNKSTTPSSLGTPLH
ncbi:hypothetical protein KAFR_0H00280 [Kazachstania africana CBS 2517]|uniref:PNPLA domain-containing protein n=1 Tax=Kazachstania africana (strain ATCC 22294 / BCRC 22015 / CBS 2517 / CECT 1963 / NBRC 1671 / NRRL Y-8276) TaxID=1071382 RepID=H2AYN1_KAZAF|nr:hypothetical protein KAFR_0H00280 [Kazachstania africana CBS 2517]CCF59437.1 hypothetical protein KAFR_0H00280 [Kazachstania africana CBS 2517]